MTTSLVIHGHFYQPPRENPWTGTLDRDPKLHPFHDWNDRIARECYDANAFARVFDSFGRIDKILNNYADISFNFGPTLLSWLAAERPATYARILDADRISRAKHGGHGNAIAQAYSHAILPLCNERDRVTQIRWGLADFQHRFHRDPEALWLPETACNDATLCALIDQGLTFAILSPYQAQRVRWIGNGEWIDVSDGTIDPGIAYRYSHRDGSGRSIALFFYDGPIARAIAFENVLVSSQTLTGRLLEGRGGLGRIVHVATDGESYGHHFRHGELTLAHALHVEAPSRKARYTNYGEYLANHPPNMEVEVKPGPGGEGTAWSCGHGVGRWYRDCGCTTDAREGWTQAWRGPLRQAFDVLRDEAARHFDATRGELFDDPWRARDDYIELILNRSRSRRDFLCRHGLAEQPGDGGIVRALRFLELQRNALLMYTSCGWFFADISGIEAVQVLKYGARALDLLEELGLPAPRERMLDTLAEAKSNVPGVGTGADVFRNVVMPQRVTPRRIAAHLAISSLVSEGDQQATAAGCEYWRTGFRKESHGRLTLATSRLELKETISAQHHDFAFASLHLGGVDFHCALREFTGLEPLARAEARLWESFRSATLPTILRVMQEEFGPTEFGLESMLPEGREQVSELVLGHVVQSFVEQYTRLYEAHQRTLEMLQRAGFDLPRELRMAAEVALSTRFMKEIEAAHRSPDPKAYRQALAIADEATRRGLELDLPAARTLFGETIAALVSDSMASDDAVKLGSAVSLVELAKQLRIGDELTRAQEIFCEAAGKRTRWPDAVAALATALGFTPSFRN